MKKIWQISERLNNDIWQHLLLSRGLTSGQEQEQFFSPQLDQLTSPADWPDMDKAVERIIKARDSKESVVVWGDFDADGVTSTAILWETLDKLNVNALPYIPNRDSEGHGFSDEGLTVLAERGTKLIVTVDHGVTAFEGIAKAQELGMEVIITDHHEPRPDNDAAIAYELPECVAVIHPFRLTKPLKLAGCGVAYALAYAVWLRAKNCQDDVAARQTFSQDTVGLAALGTIADLMPLTGDNRVLVAEGLKSLAVTTRLGLRQLYDVAGINPLHQLSVYEVGFVIAPRLNAPGRLADALDSLRLVCTKDPSRATKLAGLLNDLNIERQELLKRVVKEASKEMSTRDKLGAYVLHNDNWPAGVCGLAAGRLVEQVYRPVVVMESQGEMSRGSARSIKGFDITAALSEISHLLEQFGGHAMAAGFVCKTADITEVERLLSEKVLTQLSEDQLVPKLHIDAEVLLSDLDSDLMAQLKKLEPCGMENPQPVFISRSVKVAESRAIGKEAKHLKLRLTGASGQSAKVQEDGAISNPPTLPPSDSTHDAVAFGFGDMSSQLKPGSLIDVVYALEENVWNGKTSLQLKIKDLQLSQ